MSKKISHDSEKPAHGQQVITSCAFIHEEIDGKEKLFLPRRAATKKFLPNVLELPGGHIDFGEELVGGLKREIKEEFGMEISVGDSFYAFTYVNDIKGSHSVEIIFFCKFVGDISKIMLHPEDHSEYIWMAEDEISNVINEGKGEDDPEVIAIMKGFDRLRAIA